MSVSRNVGDYELVAYIDKESSADRRRAIDAALDEDARLSGRLANWRRNDAALRAAFGPICDEPLPAALALDLKTAPRLHDARESPEPPAPSVRLHSAVPDAARAARQGRASLVALAALAFLTGAALAVCADEGATSAPTLFRSLTGLGPPSAAAGRARLRERAIAAFRTFGALPRARIEALSRRDIADWLSQRVAALVEAPHLKDLGLRLVGGQLAPGDLGPAALVVFETAAGARVAVFIGRSSARSRALRYDEAHGVGMAWWSEDGVAHAVLGPSGASRLTAIAAEARRQYAQSRR